VRVATRREFSTGTRYLNPLLLLQGARREKTRAVLEQSGSIASNSVSIARSIALRSCRKCRSAPYARIHLGAAAFLVAQTRSRVETRLQRFS